jgi:hypothetical protein
MQCWQRNKTDVVDARICPAPPFSLFAPEPVAGVVPGSRQPPPNRSVFIVAHADRDTQLSLVVADENSYSTVALFALVRIYRF